MKNKILSALALVGTVAASASAEGVAYFDLPVGFVDNIVATVLVVAGGLLTIIGLKYAWGLTKGMFAAR